MRNAVDRVPLRATLPRPAVRPRRALPEVRAVIAANALLEELAALVGREVELLHRPRAG